MCKMPTCDHRETYLKKKGFRYELVARGSLVFFGLYPFIISKFNISRIYVQLILFIVILGISVFFLCKADKCKDIQLRGKLKRLNNLIRESEEKLQKM
jgi:hypothetical protein